MLDYNSTVPLYVQIADWLEREILKGYFQPNDKVYSQYQLAEMFQINPATAARGLTLLSEEKILYDQRGLGKFVSEQAVTIIREKRMDERLNLLIEEIVLEAKGLHITKEQLMRLIITEYDGKGET